MKRDKPLPKFHIAVELAKSKAASGDWEKVDGETLVGLYGLIHRMVYQVLPLELEQTRELRAAAREASRVLRQHFNGDVAAMVEFVKWCWERERGRAEWATREKKDRKRMGWRLQFGDAFVTDYRAAMMAKRRG